MRAVHSCISWFSFSSLSEGSNLIQPSSSRAPISLKYPYINEYSLDIFNRIMDRIKFEKTEVLDKGRP